MFGLLAIVLRLYIYSRLYYMYLTALFPRNTADRPSRMLALIYLGRERKEPVILAAHCYRDLAYASTR